MNSNTKARHEKDCIECLRPRREKGEQFFIVKQDPMNSIVP